jgi:hypothetical protein
MPRFIARCITFLLLCAVFGTGLQLSAGPKMNPLSQRGPDADVKDFRLEELKSALDKMEPGPDHDYFAGILANRENHIAESISRLTRALPTIRASRPDRAALALEALADDYAKSFRYAAAARTDDELLVHFAHQLTPGDLKETQDDAEIMRILRDAPPQTIAWDGPVKLKAARNPLNSQNVDLTVNGVRGPWLLDTGANLSLVTESFAGRLGLEPLPGIAHTQAGLTGIENPLHVALLSTLQMGGATLHNVVIMVLPDANMNINLGKSSYQINGIIGDPVFQALGTITFLQNGQFEAGIQAQANGDGARMYMRELTPVVECKVKGKYLPFSFDTGAARTDFSDRYYREFRSQSKSWKERKEESSGAGGSIKRKVFIQPEVTLGIGGKTVVLKNVPISTSQFGTTISELFGNLGQDMPAGFESFTLDFKSMSFSLGQPLSSQP